MDYTAYIKPELLVLVPVLMIIGKGLKESSRIKCKYIPIVLGFVGIILAGWLVANNHADELNGVKDWINALITAVIQGVLVAGSAVYGHQVYKQNASAENPPKPFDPAGMLESRTGVRLSDSE
jgi:uncharacterized membrane protein YeaQ/YmgE (transglycosylase-associated protein family)